MRHSKTNFKRLEVAAVMRAWPLECQAQRQGDDKNAEPACRGWLLLWRCQCEPMDVWSWYYVMPKESRMKRSREILQRPGFALLAYGCLELVCQTERNEDEQLAEVGMCWGTVSASPYNIEGI